jgi:glycerate 2-kinase
VRILVAPSDFKESLGADEVADSIEAGILRVLPDAEVLKAPMADGAARFRANDTVTYHP